MNNSQLRLVHTTSAPGGADAFELDADAFELDEVELRCFLEKTVADYGPRLQDLDLYFGGVASVGLAQLVADACDADVIVPPDGLSASAINLMPISHEDTLGLVMLEIGDAGLCISRWTTEFSSAGLTGAQPLNDLRDCLYDVVAEANSLLPTARAIAPHLPEDELGDQDD